MVVSSEVVKKEDRENLKKISTDFVDPAEKTNI